ncbi:MAG: tetratricopeptide repeat protein [Polyangiaceae bacterium]|nr:tetratricopeptide repeat protein [Polyangiaceae bacterium]MBK8942795.1 tetratricopeptide repeat protein [Polyangiaceae bacterium]
MRWLAITIFTVALFGAGGAIAQDAPPRTSAAEVLFREGKVLMDAGKLEEACRVLAESNRLEAAGGTLLNLASCYERRGLYASAERALEQAKKLAQEAGRPDAEAFIEDRLSAVRPNVSTLRVVLPNQRALEQTTVEIDGEVVVLDGGAGEVGVDPGSYSVVVETRGAPLWRQTVAVEGAGKEVVLEVPAPALLGPRATAPAAPAAAPPSPLEPVGIAGLAVGGSLLVGGVVAGVFAMDTWSDASTRCPEVQCSDRVGIAAAEDARVFGDTATGLFVAGGVVTAAGGALLILSRVLSPDAPVTSRGWVVRF